jgi:uncharacterized protein YbjT (DUF2867 family)
MRVLVLGGTSFVGRAIVEDALRRPPVRETEELDDDTYGAASQVEIVPVSPDGVPPLFPLVRTDWPPLRRGFSPQEEEQALLAQQDGHTSDR